MISPGTNEHDRRPNPVPDSTGWWLSVPPAAQAAARHVPLTSRAVVALAGWLRVRPPSATNRLFVSLRRGSDPRPLGDDRVGALTRDYSRQAGLPADHQASYVLRHTFCARLVATGVDPVRVADLAGHHDLKTTLTYLRADGAGLEDAVAAMTYQRASNNLADRAWSGTNRRHPEPTDKHPGRSTDISPESH